MTFGPGKKYENNYIFTNRVIPDLIFMGFKKQQISFSAYKTALLLLYIPFFVVQCFFNIDTAGSGSVGHIQQQLKKSLSGDNIFHSPDSSANKTNNRQVTIRLNKRFQPETTPAIDNFYLEIPVAFTITSSFGIYTNPFPALPHYFTRIVRGPPVVA